MDDLISRQAAIDALEKAIRENPYYDSNEAINGLDICDVRVILNDLPSAQPERKKGRWLPDNRPGGGFWVCSCCKFPSEAFAANVLYKFCPNCGAKMEGLKDG